MLRVSSYHILTSSAMRAMPAGTGRDAWVASPAASKENDNRHFLPRNKCNGTTAIKHSQLKASYNESCQTSASCPSQSALPPIWHLNCCLSHHLRCTIPVPECPIVSDLAEGVPGPIASHLQGEPACGGGQPWLQYISCLWRNNGSSLLNCRDARFRGRRASTRE
jgi:hypothetical protein